MNQSQIETATYELFTALLQNKYLTNDNPIVFPYIESQEVRSSMRRLANSFGVKVIRQDKYVHIMVQPHSSIFTSPLSELKRTVKTYGNRLDLYLKGVIWMVIFNEADNDVSTKIKWENEGLSYHQIEELVSNILQHWYDINQEQEGKFSEDWALAVNDMYDKWRLLRYSKEENGRIFYTKESKLGMIDGAARELEKDRMVFIERTTKTSRLTPTPVFFERLKARFGNLDKYQDRYEMMKLLIDEGKQATEEGA